jgi:phosphoglycolate phosphatase
MNSVLADYGFPPVDDAHICYAIGNGMELMCRRCIPSEHYDNADIYLPFLASYKAAYAKNYLNIDEPYAGLAETIAELKSRGYAIAALSNKPHRYTVDIVEKLWFNLYFCNSFFNFIFYILFCKQIYLLNFAIENIFHLTG